MSQVVPTQQATATSQPPALARDNHSFGAAEASDHIGHLVAVSDASDHLARRKHADFNKIKQVAQVHEDKAAGREQRYHGCRGIRAEAPELYVHRDKGQPAYKQEVAVKRARLEKRPVT